MLKRLIVGLTAVCIFGVGSWLLGAAVKDDTGHDYECTHDQMVVSDGYLAAPATCTTPATYYYSCKECNGYGTKTFAYGLALGHVSGYITQDGRDACIRCHKAIDQE